MKKDIHPEYKDIKVTCSCGNSFETKSTIGSETLHIDICSQCHPFYTGQQKLIDTAGRVDKFQQKYGKTASKVTAPTDKTTTKATAKKTK